MSAIQAERVVGERPGWRAVAMPSEHGGWGLTLEPVLLGLLVAWSTAGVALGTAAFIAFLLRTPAKLVAVDVRRGRWLDRSRLALRIAIVEAAVLAGAVVVAIASAGWSWLMPVLVAGPLMAIELSFEIRSRGRRLVPELCGAVTGGWSRVWQASWCSRPRSLCGSEGPRFPPSDSACARWRWAWHWSG